MAVNFAALKNNTNCYNLSFKDVGVPVTSASFEDSLFFRHVKGTRVRAFRHTSYATTTTDKIPMISLFRRVNFLGILECFTFLLTGPRASEKI